MLASPASERARDTRKRLDSCWQLDLAWDKYPQLLSEVSDDTSGCIKLFGNPHS